MSLPTVNTDSELLRIFGEYFSGVNNPPQEMRRMLTCLGERGDAGTSRCENPQDSAQVLAGQFIAGENLDDALATLEKLRMKVSPVSLDIVARRSSAIMKQPILEEIFKNSFKHCRLWSTLGRTCRCWTRTMSDQYLVWTFRSS